MAINLLPWREKTAKIQQKQWKTQWQIILLLSLLSIALWHWHSQQQLQQSQQQYRELQQRLQSLAQQRHEIEQQQKNVQRLQHQWLQGLARRRQQIALLKLLNQLPQLMPADIVLNQLQRQQNRLRLRGRANTHQTIVAFETALSQQFKGPRPKLSHAEHKENTGIDFELQLMIPGDG